MAENSKIEWTDYSWSGWLGCSRCAPGCENCWAEAMMDKRLHRVTWGPNGTRMRTSNENWRKPLSWNRKAEKEGVRRRVFAISDGDVFEDWYGPINDHKGNEIHFGEDALPTNMDFLRRALFALIDQTPWLDWLILTKRPENIPRMWDDNWKTLIDSDDGKIKTKFRNNVWLGTSISDQATADRNVPELLKCGDLCPVLFLSAEPLLGEVNLDANRMGVGPWHDEPWFGGISWVIVGGESGHNARPFVVEYAHDLVYQCRAANVPVFVKQMGAMPVSTNVNLYDWPDHVAIKDWGDAAASGCFVLRDKKGGDINEFPEDLRIREFPEP